LFGLAFHPASRHVFMLIGYEQIAARVMEFGDISKPEKYCIV
jgi:hypothetical protein